MIITYLVLAVAYVAAGVISQKIGRRLFLMASAMVMATAGAFLYWMLISKAPESFFWVVVLTTVTTVLITSPWGLATVYINERFQTSIRATGFGLGYSLTVILPVFFAY